MRHAALTQDDMAAFNERLARYYAGESPRKSYNDDGNVRRAGTWSAGTTKQALKRSATGRLSHMVARTEKESRSFLERSWSKLFKSTKKDKDDSSSSGSGGEARRLTEASPVWYSEFNANPRPRAAGQRKHTQYYAAAASRMASVSA